MIEFERQYAAVHAFLEAAALGDREAYIASLDALDWPTAWIDVFRAVVALGHVHPDTRLAFRDQWKRRLGGFIVHPPGGRSLRAIFADHLDLFINGLRLLLPPLQGDAPQVIFRGQSIEEHEASIVGLSWSPRPTTAEFYARNDIVNAGETVVLASFLPSDAIIGQIEDSEVVVDPRKIAKPTVILQSKSKFRPTAVSGGFLDQCETLALFELIPTQWTTGKGLGAAALPAPSP